MRKKTLITLAAGAMALGLGSASAVSVSAPLPVTPTTAGLLGFTATSTNCSGGPSTGSASFVAGPVAPPSGLGSFKLTVGPDGDSQVQLANSLFAATPLKNLTDLRYSTFVEQFGSGGQAPVIALSIDTNGDTVREDTLLFEPFRQTGLHAGDLVPNQGAVTLGTWQTWNAVAGGWTSGRFGSSVVTLATYADEYPSARIINTTSSGATAGGVRIVAGCGGAAWQDFVGYVDALTVATTRAIVADTPVGLGLSFDFEL